VQADSRGSDEPCIRWGPDPPLARELLRGPFEGTRAYPLNVVTHERNA